MYFSMPYQRQGANSVLACELAKTKMWQMGEYFQAVLQFGLNWFELYFFPVVFSPVSQL